jgi:endonuclease-3
MILKNKYRYLIEYFEKNMPVAESELNFENSYQLIVAVILSAQCTDKRVNMTTPALFERYPDAEALSKATVEDIYELIKSISYPNNKSKNLLGMAKVLMSDFNGIVPDDVDKLQTLPGVGRKTANVVASVAFNKPAMAVDTHVFRVSARIGLTKK